jgi:hypothetical protein
MKSLIRSWRIAGGVLLSGLLAAAAPSIQPGPGAVNYVEGQVNLNGKSLDNTSVGAETVQPGAVLATNSGKAEVLLMPGVFLRVGDNSEVRMLSSGLGDVEVALDRGQATVEADYWPKEARLKVVENQAVANVLKKGFYVFNSDGPFVQVLKGKADVELNGQTVSAGEDRQVIETEAGKLKAQDFNDKAVDDAALVRWSRLRSQYVAQANLDAARTVIINNGWYGPGWYWDPGWGFWSFLPANGILYSPWGWGFYSPAYVGFYYGGFYGRPYVYGRGVYRAPAVGAGAVRGFARGGFTGRFAGGGFHGGGRR